MKHNSITNNIELNIVDKFNLEDTFNCGQCFRWEKTDDNSFEGVAFDKYLKITKKTDKIILMNTSKEDFENVWKDYFDLSLNYNYVISELEKINDKMKKICNYSPGIRILKQDPWEALCSFIISQNNNIPRIKGIINRLCENFGYQISNGVYSFPKANELSTLNDSDLDILKCGFRSKYILDAAKKVSSGEINLNNIKKMKIDLARKELQKIKGVGPKVAECTLLYGMYRLEAFPMDVWMKRAMEKIFSDMKAEDFGQYAGIAQQYIFNYIRTNFES